jgi:hypothetical protein
MKTFIIQLEPHDDLNSARDKLKGAKARRVIFVWPKSGKGLADYYSLSLLRRQAERQGVEISFITQNAEVTENARLMGIPLFTSLSQAERSTWKSSRPGRINRRAPIGYQNLVIGRERLYPKLKPTRFHEFGQVMLFLIGILSLVSLVLFFIPSATVTIVPQKTSQDVTFDFIVNPTVKEINLAGIIPGNVVTVEVEGRKTAASSGKTQVGVSPASGALQLTNYSGSILDIPQGTLFIPVSQQNLSFQTTGEARLSADGNQTILVNVVAVRPGIEGNIPGGQSFVPQSGWAGSVTATNPEAFSGGSSMDSPSPTEGDLENARQALIQELEQQAREMLLVGRPQGTMLIPQSLGSTVISAVSSADPGQPADHFTLEVKMSYTATTYLQSDLNELAYSILDANLDGHQKASGDTPVISQPSRFTAEQSYFVSEISAHRLVQEQISLDDLSQALVRMPVEEAKAYLNQNLPLEKGAEITISPDWWKYMPFVSFRIRIGEQ